MDVRVDSWAWLSKAELSPDQIVNMERMLTVHPRKVGDFPGEDPSPIPLFVHTAGYFGVPREFFSKNRRPCHRVDWQVSSGSERWMPAEFAGELRPEQQLASSEVVGQFRAGRLGGILQAKPGFGKTVLALAIASELSVPTLVVVHKEFLMDQWIERIGQFLPGARIGRVQQDVCDFRDKTIVMGMVHSLASGKGYPNDFWSWPGLVVTDEVHRISAKTWSVVPAKFPARYRLGITATPRRKDGADAVFWQQIGPIIFVAKEERLKPKVKRVWTKFKLVKTDRFNPQLAPRSLLIRFLCKSRHRNALIVEQIAAAVVAGRKCLILSERLQHLADLEAQMCREWPVEVGPVSTGKYVGGQKKSQLEEAAKARVVFATVQYACVDASQPITDPITGEEYTVRGLTEEGRTRPVIGGTGCFSLQTPTAAGLAGMKECVEVELVGKRSAGGQKIVVSDDHLMWTTRGWIQAGELVAGARATYKKDADYLASPRTLSLEPIGCELTCDQAWLLGVLVGDGALSQVEKGVVQLVNADEEIVVEADRILRQNGMFLVPVRDYHYNIRSLRGRAGRGRKTWLRGVVEKYGLSRIAPEKVLPPELVKAPLPIAQQIVAGLFDSDGSVTLVRGEVAFHSSSRALLEQVRTILLRMGIPVLCDLRPGEDGVCTLRLSRVESMAFMARRLSRLKRKQVLVRGRIEIGETNAVPPVFAAELRDAVRASGFTLKQARQWCAEAGLSAGGLCGGYRELSLQAYELVGARIGFRGGLDRNVVWRRVVDVRRVGPRLVGDVAVPPTKSWLFGGVVVHNSEGLDIPALDTLFLTTPMSDVEQAVGRIQRPYEGKKDPIVVDFRDDAVPMLEAMGRKRERFYGTLA